MINIMSYICTLLCTCMLQLSHVVSNMSFTNATALRKNLFGTLDNVIEYNESVTVNTKKGNAVILSEADYNAMMETIYLTSQKGLVKKIKDGEKENTNNMETFDPEKSW